jgi:hypothetical protein
MPGVNNTHA